DNPGFAFNYANAYESLGQFKQARIWYQKTITLAPQSPEAYCNLGNVLQEEGDYAEAVRSFEKAISLSSEFARQYPQIYINLGNALMDMGQDKAALTAYQQTVKIQQDNVGAYIALGNALLQQGQKQEAAEALSRAISLKPESGSAFRNLVQTRGFAERDTDVETMELLYGRADLGMEDKMELAFALGKVYADLKLDAQSFEYYRQGNALKRATLDYSIGQDRELFAAIKQTVTSEFLQRHAGTGCDDATPIFIIGMPRSGTTLTEQILASHSQVHGAGELNELKFLIERACESHTQEFPQGLLGLNKTELSAIASTYLERLHAYAPGAPRITDKMPHNFLYLGLIHLLFPKAKIIHCLRNPMDNALSIYRALFARSHAYAYDLEELGQYYHLYQDLMAHWRKLMPGGFYELRYEDLVTDQEAQTRRLLEYCELPWEDACLEFYQTSRVVRTASLAQVRQPMHRNSVEAWRRFERQLQPFVQALRA
ncbi:MAG: sulfotransferase, partial [Gammaproteobacteria bacterium]